VTFPVEPIAIALDLGSITRNPLGLRQLRSKLDLLTKSTDFSAVTPSFLKRRLSSLTSIEGG